jgi:hypothetical protein
MHCDPLRICHNYTSKIINPASQWPMIRIFQLQEAGIYITLSVEISCGFRISLPPSTLPSNNIIERWNDLLRLTQFLYYTKALLCLCYLQFKLVTLILIYVCVCVCIYIYIFFFLLLRLSSDIFGFVIQAKDIT